MKSDKPEQMQYNHDVRAGASLIGRDHELSTLDGFLAGMRRCALVIRGDAGIGKTALVEESADRADGQGWQIVRAVGVEAEQSFALGGLNQVAFSLREHVAELDGHDQAALAPVLGADPVAAPAPMVLTMALLTLLAHAASSAPVLLIVEDMHWFDEISATVLSAAGRRLSHPRVRVLATTRNQYREGVAQGWADIDMAPLSAGDAELLIDRSALPLSPAARHLILEVSAGNPLALSELPRSAGQIREWSSTMPLTERLVSVFGARLRILDDRVRTELLRGALDGTPASAAGDHTARYTMVGIQTAIDHGLLSWNPSGEIVFRHALVRAAVIHQATAAQRRDAHAHLAGLYGDVLVRRATHLSAAATTPNQDVANLLDEAAHLSIRRGGAATAVDWLRRAAQLSTDASRRNQLRDDAAFVASQSNRFDDAGHLADDSGSDPDSPAAVLTAAYLALYRNGDVLTSHQHILGALLDAHTLDDLSVLRLVKVLLAVTLYSGDPQLWQLTDDAVDQLTPRLDGDALLFRDAWGDVTRRGHTVVTRLNTQREHLQRREPWDVMRLGVAAYYVDHLTEFTSALGALFDRESQRGAITNAMTMLHLLLLDQLASGDWERAAESIRLGTDLTLTHRNDLFHHQFIAYHGLLAAVTGDTATARQCADRVHAWAAPRQLGLLLTIIRRTTTHIALGAGDYAAANDAATADYVSGQLPPYSKQLIEELLDLVESAVHAGRLDRAEELVRNLVDLRIADISSRLAALSAAAQAMTSSGEEAADLYAFALAHRGLSRYPFERNRIRLNYGMWLRRHRRTAQAREQLTLAADGFHLLGAVPWERRCLAELRAAGVNVKRATADAAATLTPQERTIAELAAAGRSNKQIAEQLYLSPRTIGAHLYRIFPKLGITSRAALAQALGELA